MAEGRLPNLPGPTGWYTPEEAAELMQVSPSHIRLLCRRGLLVGRKERGRWWITKISARLYRRNLANPKVFRKAYEEELARRDNGAG